MGRRGPLGQNQIASASSANGREEPRAPKGLSKAARAEWDRITRLLRKRNVLDGIDQNALQDFIVCWERLQTAEADIQARGLLVPGDRGLVKNPSIQIGRQYRNALLAWAKELGLTLNSRARLQLPEPKSRQALIEELTA